jgi:hypothetical protein
MAGANRFEVLPLDDDLHDGWEEAGGRRKKAGRRTGHRKNKGKR